MITTVCTNRLNSVLIADYVRPLYIPDGVLVLDPTYGKGGWWRKWKPERFIAHDLYKLDGVDFRALPEETGSVDVVAFDPVYVPPGGRETSTIKGMHDAYGMDTSPRTPELCRDEIRDGIREATRVLAPVTGILLVKSQDYVWGGKCQPGHGWVLEDAGLGIGQWTGRGGAVLGGRLLERVDEFVHVTGTGPQPTKNRDGSPRPQRHARASHSFLTVFRRTRAR